VHIELQLAGFRLVPTAPPAQSLYHVKIIGGLQDEMMHRRCLEALRDKLAARRVQDICLGMFNPVADSFFTQDPVTSYDQSSAAPLVLVSLQ